MAKTSSGMGMSIGAGALGLVAGGLAGYYFGKSRAPAAGMLPAGAIDAVIGAASQMSDASQRLMEMTGVEPAGQLVSLDGSGEGRLGASRLDGYIATGVLAGEATHDFAAEAARIASLRSGLYRATSGSFADAIRRIALITTLGPNPTVTQARFSRPTQHVSSLGVAMKRAPRVSSAVDPVNTGRIDFYVREAPGSGRVFWPGNTRSAGASSPYGATPEAVNRAIDMLLQRAGFVFVPQTATAVGGGSVTIR